MEVKGVTLEEDGVAKFPDAPTERGARHLTELTDAAAAGYGAYVLFVIQMKGVTSFTPFLERDRHFTKNLIGAKRAGVEVMAYDTIVTPENITLDRAVDIFFPQGEGIL
jgi:sugar fermentation stimulation protein A